MGESQEHASPPVDESERLSNSVRQNGTVRHPYADDRIPPEGQAVCGSVRVQPVASAAYFILAHTRAETGIRPGEGAWHGTGRNSCPSRHVPAVDL